jgi:hypothetical protein
MLRQFDLRIKSLVTLGAREGSILGLGVAHQDVMSGYQGSCSRWTEQVLVYFSYENVKSIVYLFFWVSENTAEIHHLTNRHPRVTILRQKSFKSGFKLSRGNVLSDRFSSVLTWLEIVVLYIKTKNWLYYEWSNQPGRICMKVSLQLVHEQSAERNYHLWLFY